MPTGMNERVKDLGEFGLIDRITALLESQGVRPMGIQVGLGDDAAAFLPRPGKEILLTCDSLVEGRHFRLEYFTPFDLGQRAMAVNLSDIGAMGGRPLYALVSLGLKGETAVAEIEGLYQGFLEVLRPYGAAVIGGNITGVEDRMFIDVTLVGEADSGKVLRRSGAAPGDSILVTGYPGQAAAGLKLLLRSPNRPAVADHPLVRAYLRPNPPARLGALAAEQGAATAAIDISDGFLGDLGHICEASRVGALLWEERLPLSRALIEQAGFWGQSALDFFFGDSDDYELILTCREGDGKTLQKLAARCDPPVILTEVGRITSNPGHLELQAADGAVRGLEISGWDHFRRT